MHIVFICWGNICRSPAAEATFRKMVKDRNLEEKITCDSAGTISQHQETPDLRMRQAGAKRIQPCGSARMVNDEDFTEADLLLTMDEFNYSELSRLAPDQESQMKIKPFCDYLSSGFFEVPDPYYGGDAGFEKFSTFLRMDVPTYSTNWNKNYKKKS